MDRYLVCYQEREAAPRRNVAHPSLCSAASTRSLGEGYISTRTGEDCTKVARKREKRSEPSDACACGAEAIAGAWVRFNEKKGRGIGAT